MSEADPLDVTGALEAARKAAEDALAVADAPDEASTDLVPTGTDAAMAVKAQMAQRHAQVAQARKTALEAQRAARDAIRAQQDALEATLRKMQAELAPLEEKIALMQEGVATLNLYLGRDEEIVQLAEGEPADASTPIHVRQQVLAMDEESMLAAEHGGIDVRHIGAFDEWITSNPAHLDQVLPEQRGVVAIMPSRSIRDYGDPWVTMTLNDANRQTWWLIRNGQNVYRMLTALNVGARLVPARDEFTAMFVDRWTGKPLEPGTREWLEQEKRAAARERHFMKIALILQGLIDRTTVFHPLPKAGLSLLSPEDYDAGHVVLIADDEHQLTSGRTPFYQWLRSLNSRLAVGMRVMVATRHHAWPSISTEGWNRGEHERLWPRRASSPISGQVYQLSRKGAEPESFVFTYERTDTVWDPKTYRSRPAKSPASCTIFTSDKFVVPIDLVSVDEMRAYLEARTERHAYIDMAPTLKAAIQFKEDEATAEAPFRDLLTAQIAQAENLDLDTAAKVCDEMVTWWKIANKWHRPLVGDEAAEAKAAKAILAERRRIARANSSSDADRDANVVAKVLAAHPDALLVARRKDGRYSALVPSPVTYPAIVPKDVWVDRLDVDRDGTTTVGASWQTVNLSSVNRWIWLHEGEAWAKWRKTARAKDFFTGPELTEAIERVKTLPAPSPDAQLMAVTEGHGWRGTHLCAFWHPGRSRAHENPLTGGYPAAQRVLTLDVEVSKDADGVHLSTRFQPDEKRWANGRNNGIKPLTTGDPKAPWVNALWQDDAVIDVAHECARQVEQERLGYAALESRARQFVESIEVAWWDAHIAAARARHIEDFADDTLFDPTAVRRKLKYPWGWHQNSLILSRPNDAFAAAVRYAVCHLVETGRSPEGLTLVEAVSLAEREDLEVDFSVIPEVLTDWRFPPLDT